MHQISVVFDEYHKKKEQEDRQKWELARFIGYCSIAPHAKKHFSMHDLAIFDWERTKIEEEQTKKADWLLEQTKKLFPNQDLKFIKNTEWQRRSQN